METIKKPQKKKNRKPLYILLCTLIAFSIFIYFLVKPSMESNASQEINSCLNTEDVKATWYKYKIDLSESEDFCQAARDKLSSFNLKQSEIVEVKKWLPSKSENLNLILVPDLSLRITDQKNNPDQVQNDTTILSAAWKAFEKKVMLKLNSKDKLTVDVADPSQAQDQFRTIADNLVFDLSEHKNKSNRFYFANIQDKFQKNINRLYDIATKKTTGANYVYYFSEILPKRIKKSTLDDNYKNILVIITDGYLEITGKPSTSPNTAILRQYCNTRNSSSFSYPNETADLTFPELDVYLLEVNEKQSGKGCDFQGLKKWWTEWLKLMNIHNIENDIIIKRDYSISTATKEIEQIINAK